MGPYIEAQYMRLSGTYVVSRIICTETKSGRYVPPYYPRAQRSQYYGMGLCFPKEREIDRGGRTRMEQEPCLSRQASSR